MSRTTGPIEFTHVYGLSSIWPLPWSVNAGGVVWVNETYWLDSPVYTALALGEQVESVSGSIGISLDAEAASAITVWLNMVPVGNVEPGETLDLSFSDMPLSVQVEPFVDLLYLRVTRIGDFNGELLGECPFTLNSLTVDFTVATDEEPVGECFWTDLLGVAEDCGGSTKGQQVDAIISSWYGEFSEYSSWTWRGGALYEPSDPPGETTYHWMPALPPGTTIWYVRNTAVGGAQGVDYSSFYIDFEQGRIGTDEIVASPVTNDWGGSGPYGASGLFIELDGVDLSQLYPLLPPEYQYADAEYYAWLPARRGYDRWRTTVNVQMSGYGAGEWQLFAYASPRSLNVPLVDGVTPAPTSIVATTPTPSGPASGGSMHISPPGYEESAYLNNVVLTLNYYPQGLSHINITGWLAPEIGVALPGVIDAYIDDLEYFEGEDVALDEFLFPPAGTGVALPDVRLPVTWNMDWGAWGLGAEWGDVWNAAHILPSGPGVYIGTLRRTNGAAICKIAYVLGQGAGPGA